MRVDHILSRTALAQPQAVALEGAFEPISYRRLECECHRIAGLLRQEGVTSGARVAIYLEKRPESVIGMLAAARAGALFVPVNPALRRRQAHYLLEHAGASVLITTSARLALLDSAAGGALAAVRLILLVGSPEGEAPCPPGARVLAWDSEPLQSVEHEPHRPETDPVAILYTSGSSGSPKGVLLSHRNLLAGAESVAEYLGLQGDDRIVATLPFSFDYGLNQLLSSLLAGARCLLVDYLTPGALLADAARFGATTLAGVPSLWQAVAREAWPTGLVQSLRRMTNSGGHLPATSVHRLRAVAPEAQLFLMYGLTEAFRSTYLPPQLVDRHPGSIGRAVPNAELAVVRPDGTPCGVHEEGELVHRGPFVALGYWNDPQATQERFRPWPLTPPEWPRAETAVWSGDRVYYDGDGLLYFAGRADDMIKTSGYRVSPTEVESVVYAAEGVAEAVALGVPDEALGEAILLVYRPAQGEPNLPGLRRWCRRELPNYMQPRLWVALAEGLPRTAHGKFDRPLLRRQWQDGTLQASEEHTAHGD